MDELGAKFNCLVTDALGEDATAYPALRLKDQSADAVSAKSAGCCKACNSSAENENVCVVFRLPILTHISCCAVPYAEVSVVNAWGGAPNRSRRRLIASSRLLTRPSSWASSAASSISLNRTPGR